ncbi:hypothetical protein AVEN_13281-1 [Araneus ventricosus]|uniref:Uncharacterized protein n=1 Tax=Araneus ventricosus TaxID=182803 RepID=A0A4Y2EXG2_ARAVE|nr:hypothetical protein AVEN_13281-1 [Araneus ventricosus]
MAENADLFALLAEMKKSMEKGQERIEKEMRSGQEEMKKVQEDINSCIERIEDVQSVKREIGDVKGEVQRKIEEVEEKVQGKIGDIEKRLYELEDRPLNFPANPGSHFDVVSSANGWNNHVKASQLVASLRGSAVPQRIPSDKLSDLTTIENALEARFGDSHLTQFYRTELKTRRQKPGESLQVLADDVERLMSLAYAECPQDVRDSLAVQYFVDAIRDEDIQHATRLMDAKDLKSSLAYSMRIA